MCGICGFTGDPDDALLRAMMDRLHHRGPDARGELHAAGVSLGHTRLSIIDLSTGEQPIYNEDRTVAVVFNGEIYNFRELRDDLEKKGHRFSTRTDTEVLVHLYEEHGLDLGRHLNGMYAFALLDIPRRRLALFRDPVGIKPLHYTFHGDRLLFASEIKALVVPGGRPARMDRDSAHLLLNVRYVPGTGTLFEGIQKLAPGHRLVFEDGRARVERFWDWPSRDPSMGAREAVEGFFETVRAAVERQMVSDVPLGLFLSGGLDSSTLVAAASRSAPDRVRTFALGFGEPTDELPDARAVAERFGTEHHEMTLSPDGLGRLPEIVYHVEEPKVNAAQGFFLSEFARRHVKVALSGMGGDELFVGYEIFQQMETVQRTASTVGGAGSWVAGASRGLRSLGMNLLGPRFENARRGLELLMSLDDPASCYVTLRNAWDTRDDLLREIYRPAALARISVRTRDVFAPFFRGPSTMAEDSVGAEFATKMVDDFLTNEDRVSMAHSLELRVPFLDLETVAFARRIPFDVAYKDRSLKWVMKQAMAKILPPRTIAKPKWGFTFNPYHQFRKDLRGLARRFLTPERLERLDMVRPDRIQAILDHPPSPRMRWHYFFLWTVLGLCMWQDIFEEGKSPSSLHE